MSKSTYIKKTMAIILIIIASVAGFITSDRYFNQNKEVNFKSLLVYPQAKKFTGFKLNDQNNKEITIDDFKGKWTLMFFGFTSCPDVCPTTLTEIQKVYKLVKSKTPDSFFNSAGRPKSELIKRRVFFLKHRVVRKMTRGP